LTKLRRMPPWAACSLAVLVLTACAGAAPAPAPGARGTLATAPGAAQAPAATARAAARAPVATSAPVATPAPLETAADGGDPSLDAGGGTPGPACRLVTQQEVEAATSLPFLAGGTEDTGCTFNGDFNKGNFTSVVIDTDPNNTIAAAKVDFTDGHDVTGLGHAAYWSPSVTELWVDAGGNRTLQVQLVLFDISNGQDYLPAAQALAKLALSRL
jgi:hypothetical protein